MSFINIFQKALSIIFLLIAIRIAWLYPVINFYLCIGVLLYFTFLIRYPVSWLFFLPILLSLLNVAPWSGWVLLEEFDIFVLATLAVGMWKGTYIKKSSYRLNIYQLIAIGGLSLSVLISLWIGLIPLQKITPNDFSNYLTHYNSLRISRSFLWALALFPLLNYHIINNQKLTLKMLSWGVIVSIIGITLVIFWERGVIGDIITASNKHDFFRSLLDFSSEYRTTALFSDMNTGGAALDGYIVMTWVFALGLLFSQTGDNTKNLITFKTISINFICYLALACAIYTIATTFTRITYLAFGFSLLVFWGGLLFRSRKEEQWVKIYSPILWAGIFLLTWILIKSFAIGGYIALAAGLFVLLGGIITGTVTHRLTRNSILSIILLLFALGVLISVRAIITSKYVYTSLPKASLFAILIIFALLLVGFISSKYASNKDALKSYYSFVVPLIIILSITIPMLSGYRMQYRFASSMSDAQIRLAHWKDVLGAMNNNWFTILAGMGSGSFPRNFFASNKHAQGIGKYSYETEDDNLYLRIYGGSDIEIGQRFFLESNRELNNYILRFKARSNIQTNTLNMRFCQRNLVWAADCNYYGLPLKGPTNKWNEYEIPIKTESLKNIKWYAEWPNVFLIRTLAQGAIVDIDDIRLTDNSSQSLIDNGNFKKGGQRWFSYNEFEHLPWHTKNMWLHLFFEQGLLGVVSFAFLLACSAMNTFKNYQSGNSFGLVFFTSIAGTLVVGLTGSLIDSPRVTLILLLIAFSALLISPQKNEE